MILFLLLQWQVFFSPGAGVSDAIVRNIDSARVEILVQAYSFTSGPIAEALCRAKDRGVTVRVQLDKSNVKNRGSQYRRLWDCDVMVESDIGQYNNAKKIKIAHNKVMVIDSLVVITGSYNFTKAAETANAENLLIVRDSALARHYLGNWWQRANKH